MINSRVITVTSSQAVPSHGHKQFHDTVGPYATNAQAINLEIQQQITPDVFHCRALLPFLFSKPALRNLETIAVALLSLN